MRRSRSLAFHAVNGISSHSVVALHRSVYPTLRRFDNVRVWGWLARTPEPHLPSTCPAIVDWQSAPIQAPPSTLPGTQPDDPAVGSTARGSDDRVGRGSTSAADSFVLLSASPVLHALLHATALAPVEEEHLDPIRRGRHDRRAEVAAIAGWYTAEYPGRRGADDIAGGVEGLDGELHAIGRQAGVHVVHVAADDGPRGARLHLIFDPEVSIEAFLRVVRRRCSSGGDRHHGHEHESETNSTHRRTSTPKTRNRVYRFRVSRFRAHVWAVYLERRRFNGSPGNGSPVIVSCLTRSSASVVSCSASFSSSPWTEPVTSPE